MKRHKVKESGNGRKKSQQAGGVGDDRKWLSERLWITHDNEEYDEHNPLPNQALQPLRKCQAELPVRAT